MHKSHKTRYSDSSFYDEVCVKCGITDSNRDWEQAKKPCPKANAKEEPYKGPIATINNW